MARLTRLVRRLIALSVSSAAPSESLNTALEHLERAARDLETHVPKQRPPRFAHTEALAGAGSLERAMPFDMVIGPYNPLAPPIRVEFDAPRAIGRVVFGSAYEGAPGWVHGAALAGAFDMVLTAANQFHGTAGPTVKLTIRYRRPTLIGTESLFEAWVEATTAHRVLTKGRLLQGDTVTVEAEGHFAVMDPRRFMKD